MYTFNSLENNKDGTLTIYFTDDEAPIEGMGIKFNVKYEDYKNFTLEHIFKSAKEEEVDVKGDLLNHNIVEGDINEIKCGECRNQYDSEYCVGCSKENNFRNFQKI
jgi:hypothetical protein